MKTEHSRHCETYPYLQHPLNQVGVDPAVCHTSLTWHSPQPEGLLPPALSSKNENMSSFPAYRDQIKSTIEKKGKKIQNDRQEHLTLD